ncbi:hypothetical protein D3C80_781730 [compost metagenome]
MVKISAFWAEIFPAGISRIAVLGLIASISRSKYLLKAIAAFRAVTMHNNINSNSFQEKAYSVVSSAKKKPIRANGNANTLWANKTKERYFFMR